MKNSKLKALTDKLQRLDEDIRALNTDKSEIYKELKGEGYDPKIVRKCLSILKQGEGAHGDEQALIDTYLAEMR